MVKKIIDHFKCNPLACMGVYLTIVSLLFGILHNDIMQIRQLIFQRITGQYVSIK